MPSSKNNSKNNEYILLPKFNYLAGKHKQAREVADILASHGSTFVTADAILGAIGQEPGDRYIDISSDMSVRAEIKTDQQRVIDYFLSPLKIYVSKSLSER